MHHPNDSPRQSWEEAFQRMAAEGDDKLLDAGSQLSADWDCAEWTWPNGGERSLNERIA